MTKHQIMHCVVGPVMTNCYILINQDTRECVVIDPGASGEAIAEKLAAESYKPVAVLVTHAHFDHMDGCEDLVRACGGELPVYIHRREESTLSDSQLNVSAVFGMGNRSYSADVFLDDEQEINLAGFRIRTLFTPGHTPGGCSYYLPEEGILFSGDTLFCASVGRTDMPGGSMSQLVRSIREQLFVLPDDTIVYPGHNETTTIGFEKENNPFA